MAVDVDVSSAFRARFLSSSSALSCEWLSSAFSLVLDNGPRRDLLVLPLRSFNYKLLINVVNILNTVLFPIVAPSLIMPPLFLTK